MKDNLIFWKKKLKSSGSKRNSVAILAGLLIIAVCVAGGALYVKKVNDDKLAAEVERQKIKRTQESITTFYRKALSGIDLNQLPAVMREIEHSRLPISMVGFTENEFNCINKTCSFIYELNDMFVFTVTDKVFFNTTYEGSFTENTLNFKNVMIRTGIPQLLSNMNTGSSIDAVKCGNVLNFLYGYNSVMEQSDRVKVTKLPFSSIATAEQQFPSYKDSYGLLTGEFEASVSDGYSEAYLFAEKNPYKDLFIVQNIEKSVKTGSDVILKGVFVCKK